MVGWNLRTISIVMLAVLSVLPVSRALCTMMCDAAPVAEAAAHHLHGASDHPDTVPNAPGVELKAFPEHVCANHELSVQAILKSHNRDYSSAVTGVAELPPASSVERRHGAVALIGYDILVTGGIPPNAAPLPLRI